MCPDSIILTGPPCSGKDTISELLEYHGKFKVAVKHSTSCNPNTPYYSVTKEEFLQKVNAGLFLQWNERYGRLYGVSAAELNRLKAACHIPIIHMGRLSDVTALKKRTGSLVIMLWESEEVLKSRLTQRNAREVELRLNAYKEEFHEWLKFPNVVDVYIRNNDITSTLLTIMKASYLCKQAGLEEFEKYMLNLT